MTSATPKSRHGFTTAQLKARRRRGLAALDAMAQAQFDLMRWRLIRANLPAKSAPNLIKRADLEIADTLRKLNGYREVIWAAMGYDPEAEEDPPATHWDKGAMED